MKKNSASIEACDSGFLVSFMSYEIFEGEDFNFNSPPKAPSAPLPPPVSERHAFTTIAEAANFLKSRFGE